MAKETKAVRGIEVTLDPDVLQDWDVVNDLMALTPGEDADDEKSIEETKAMFEAMNRIADTLYGKDFDRYKRKLRSANGGKLPVDLVVGFINDTFEAFQKN